MSAAPVSSKTRFQGRVVSFALPVRPRPRSGRWAVHRTSDRRTVFIDPGVLVTVDRELRRHAPDETAGLLFGRSYRDGDGPYSVVTAAEPPGPGEVEGTVGTVKITAAGSEQMAARFHERDFIPDVLGWWHTHPRYAAFYSPTDRDEQAHWSSQLAVGMVVADAPGAGEPYAVFLGPDCAEAHLIRRGQAVPGLAPASELASRSTRADRGEIPAGAGPVQNGRPPSIGHHEFRPRLDRYEAMSRAWSRQSREIREFREIDEQQRGQPGESTLLRRRLLIVAAVIAAAVALVWLVASMSGDGAKQRSDDASSLPGLRRAIPGLRRPSRVWPGPAGPNQPPAHFTR